MVEVVLDAFDAPFRLFPYPLSLRLVESDLLQGIGAALIVIAIGLFIAALIAFGKSWRVGIDEQHPGQLVRGGIFAISRNPIFVSLDLYFLGTFLINGTLGFLLFAAAGAAGVHYQIHREEQFLRKQYGPAYETYRRATNRYLGRATLPRVA
jgi:protein-S-isoprenylcysteine O-methyltransferase Ste14